MRRCGECHNPVSLLFELCFVTNCAQSMLHANLFGIEFLKNGARGRTLTDF